MAVVYIYIRKLIEKKYKIDLLLTMIISISATIYLFTEIKKKKRKQLLLINAIDLNRFFILGCYYLGK